MPGPLSKWMSLFLAAAWLLATACENDMQKVAALGRHSNAPEEGHGIDAYLSQSGHMKARLLAPYMLRYGAPDTPKFVFPQTLHVDFYDSLLNVSSLLDARYGIYYETLNKVYLSDHVKILNLVKKDTIYCQDLYWDQNTGKYYTHRPVEVHSVNQTLFGTGMEANQDLTNFQLDSAHGPIRVRDNQLP